jgi:hypothetical protein
VLPLPRARLAGTRQRLRLCRVFPNTLDKGTSKWAHMVFFFAEGRSIRHSAKEPLPSVTVALNKVSVTVTWRRDGDFFFAECPTKSTRQRSRCRYAVHRDFYVECHTRAKTSSGVFQALPSGSGTLQSSCVQ